jgi:enoyl-CoA hydratase
MSYNNILVAKENSIATITINRPTKLNALNTVTIKNYIKHLRSRENYETRVIILTGSGEKLVAGADIAEFADFSIEEGVQLAAQGQDILFNFVENLKIPVIAANGLRLEVD